MDTAAPYLAPLPLRHRLRLLRRSSPHLRLGLDLFSRGQVKDALSQFDAALTLNPNTVEAQAAFYNKACCHAYRGEGRKAAECLRTALKEYNLKFGTILNDPDLASFRALPEFKELQEEVGELPEMEALLSKLER